MSDHSNFQDVFERLKPIMNKYANELAYMKDLLGDRFWTLATVRWCEMHTNGLEKDIGQSSG